MNISLLLLLLLSAARGKSGLFMAINIWIGKWSFTMQRNSTSTAKKLFLFWQVSRDVVGEFFRDQFSFWANASQLLHWRIKFAKSGRKFIELRTSESFHSPPSAGGASQDVFFSFEFNVFRIRINICFVSHLPEIQFGESTGKKWKQITMMLSLPYRHHSFLLFLLVFSDFEVLRICRVTFAAT